MKKTKGLKALRTATGAALLTLLLLVGGAGAVTSISSCTTITSPGEYVLAESIINSSAPTCINITSNDVIFDGVGYTIDGIDTGDYGIYVYDPVTPLTNVIIKNLNITDWNNGIYYEARNGSIAGSLIRSNTYGIFLFNSRNVTLTGNAVNSNNNGIFLVFGSGNILINNIANSNYNGIYLDTSDNNILINNTASWNNWNWVWGGSGINLFDSQKNILSGNAANHNKGTGFSLYFSNSNILNHNIAGYNEGEGIYLESSSYNIMTNSTVNSNFGGIYITIFDEFGGSTDNLIYHNNMINNSLFQGRDDTLFVKNKWYHPELLEGNYWSDYKGVDNGNGTGRHSLSGDHIGDTMIPHPSAKYDSYPYVNMTGWMMPSIVLHTDKTTYLPGDTMIISLKLTNPDGDIDVAAGIWIDLPDGSRYPVYENPSIILPGGFDYTDPVWLKLTLPSIPSGNYALYASLIKNPENETISETFEPWTFNGSSTAGMEDLKSFEESLQKGSGDSRILN